MGRVDQRLHAQRALADLAQHLLEVAALGPAHVAERVVLALLLVARIVAAGPIRSRDQEVDLFLVDLVALDPDRHVADEHDAALAAAGLEGLVEQPRVAAGRGHDHSIGALAARALEDARGELALADGEAAVEAERLGPRDAVWPHVDSDHHRAGRLQHLHRDLAEQAQSQDRDPIAQARLGAAHALQRDRSKRAEGGLLE